MLHQPHVAEVQLISSETLQAKFMAHKRLLADGYRPFTVLLLRSAALSKWTEFESSGLDVESNQVMALDKYEAIQLAQLAQLQHDEGEGAGIYMQRNGQPPVVPSDYRPVCVYGGHFEVMLYGHQYLASIAIENCHQHQAAK